MGRYTGWISSLTARPYPTVDSLDVVGYYRRSTLSHDLVRSLRSSDPTEQARQRCSVPCLGSCRWMRGSASSVACRPWSTASRRESPIRPTPLTFQRLWNARDVLGCGVDLSGISKDDRHAAFRKAISPNPI